MNQNVTPQAPFPPTQYGPDPQLFKLAGQIHSGSNWIMIIAGLSALNSLINAFGGQLTFVIGMGITQLMDAFGLVMAQEVPELATIIQVVAVFLSFVAAGVLAILGLFARRGHAWAFILAGLGYFVDTLLVLYFQDFLGLLFHALALFYIASGAWAALKFRK